MLDEALDVAPQIHNMLASLEAEATLTCSAHEFQLAEESQAAADLRIVILSSGLSGWDVARLLRDPIAHGTTLVFYDERHPQPGLEHLEALPHLECLPKPRTAGELEAVLERVLRQVRPSGGVSDAESDEGGVVISDIIGRSPQIREVFARIEKVASGNANVCIFGESGTGKELIARAIHENSPRRERPLITLDCTAVPEGLMESHLFGHLKGSFTGAIENRDGVFSLAHTGTLFIDEISELPLALQAKLLRVIQTREFVKVGGTRPIRTDIRLITASNKDLRKAVEKGTFREDLYYRIAVVMIHTPALRDRRGDVPLLAEHFVAKFGAAHRKRIRGLTPQAMDVLTGHHWPGNVRQLENCIEQAVVLCEGDTLGVDLLPLADTAPPSPPEDGALRLRTGLTLRDVERHYILRTLQDHHGNRTRAARALGISLRCLQYKLKAYAGEGVDLPAQPNRVPPPKHVATPEPKHLLGV
ncbi:MAG: sigma-54 dependent transcriptional regulator [Candidatus Rokubacteria bacterium]|nr:sigma-54 dependent transcriptional regulator [Candidatus Rokubacteria bacterium]